MNDRGGANRAFAAAYSFSVALTLDDCSPSRTANQCPDMGSSAQQFPCSSRDTVHTLPSRRRRLRQDTRRRNVSA